ncbi:unnamed protein product [Gongylonema pulchrum]|uniref:Secreted protein n=1 Tax=Gongylonema pulchrum TaxID=637853 RepID=A0A183DLZ7_9BILA|nr:unnamed protein product [Gongylonema pulchrum]
MQDVWIFRRFVASIVCSACFRKALKPVNLEQPSSEEKPEQPAFPFAKSMKVVKLAEVKIVKKKEVEAKGKKKI